MKTNQRNKMRASGSVALTLVFLCFAPISTAQTNDAAKASTAEKNTSPTALTEWMNGGEGALSKAASAILAEQYKTDPEFRIRMFDVARAEHHSGDGKKAIRIFTQLANHAGHTPSMRWLGRMAYGGEAQKVDKALAFDWYQKAAMAGDVDAMLETAGHLLAGIGTQQSDRAARHWLVYAADRGSDDADAMLLKMFDEGLGGPADPKMAMVFAKRLAKAFKPDGLYYMGVAYRDGDRVVQNLEEARRMLEAAQEYGHDKAAAALAVMDYEIKGDTP